MPVPSRQTIAPQVFERFQRWIQVAETYVDPDSFEFKSALRDAERLASAKDPSAPLHSWLLRGMLFQVTGNIDEVVYCCTNARRLSPKDTENADNIEIVALCNLGYFTRAHDLLVVNGEEDIRSSLLLALVTGAFAWASKWGSGASFAEEEECKAIVAMARRCVVTLERLGITEDHVRRVLDLAGEVVRKHRIFFVGDAPIIRTTHEGLLYQQKLSLSPERASELTLEVIDLMIEADLDTSGIYFSFLGVADAN